jgi:SpoVK/Ycf46/Vps4 family AAA+-type ATPase
MQIPGFRIVTFCSASASTECVLRCCDPSTSPRVPPISVKETGLLLKAQAKNQNFSLGPLSLLKERFHQLLAGKEDLADTLLCALLSGGHVLFEDVPGVGKTTLIKAISKILGLEMSRIQCTSDLLPSDILGVEIYQSETERIRVSTKARYSRTLFLVDELNRCSPSYPVRSFGSDGRRGRDIE